MAKTKATMKVSEKFNLAEMFDLDVFPDNEKLKIKIANDIIDAIKKNTSSGKDKNGKSFKKYSDSYKKSLQFKAFGKSSNVNMKLSGDMIELMEPIKITENTITIGWTDEQQKLKAENHIHGVTLPERDFLGLPEDILEKIINKNRPLVERAAEDNLTDKDKDLLGRE